MLERVYGDVMLQIMEAVSKAVHKVNESEPLPVHVWKFTTHHNSAKTHT